MSQGHRSGDEARSAAGSALTAARRTVAGSRARPTGLLALQRSAGNGAVNALLAARLRFPGAQARSDIDAALVEVRGDDPVVEVVEKGLKAAQEVGIPVELEGPKPPASALAVTTTGFGPGSVAEKKPVPPPKPVPAVNPLGKAAAKTPRPVGGGPAAAAPAAPMAAAEVVESEPTAPSTEGLPVDAHLQPPAPPTGTAPEDDPAFTAVTGNVTSYAKSKKSHPPAASKAKEAQGAAVPPTGDIPGQAQAAKADTMDAQQPGAFDKKAFIAAVKTAIEAKSPKTLKEADDYSESGKAGEVKDDVKGMVTSGKQGESKDIEAATAAPPDESKAVPKQVTPMATEAPGATAAIPATGAVPKPAPTDQLNLAAAKHQANQEMADGQVTEAQLAESNEPDFQQALADKHVAAAHADTAPGEYRKQETDAIAQEKAGAAGETNAAVDSIHGSKVTALAALVADKGKTKSKDEAKRAEVTAKIQSIFTATEADVKKILDGIDPKVEAAFDQGEAKARAAFESYVSAKMSAYKEDRYSGWLGGLRWAKDKLLGMPDKVNEFYEAGREIYLKQMDTVISQVADIVGTDLSAAKKRIATGKAEIAGYVKSLPAALQKVGTEASTEIGDKFAQLEDDVNAKQDSLVDTLATKYTQARKGLDDRIEELQAENKGLVDKAIGAIKAVINTIRQLASMLMNVLARVAGVVGDIIKHPVKFLGSLIDGVKGGILKFKDTIVDHLRKGLMSWLFGTLAEAGVELPDSFDPRGIIKLLGSIFGMTWANIRNRIVKKIGEKAMSAAEKGVEIFQLLAREGIGGLWQMLLDKLGDIKEMILEQVKDFVITKIITAGIQWLIGLLNPAAAFIKACKLIYDIIMFFVTNAERIAAFVNTVIDSVADMVRGNVSAVIDKVDDALGKMVPILIGFLANLVNLGGIGQKVREIVEKLQKPVNKALDFVINTGLKLAGPIIRGISGISKRVKAKVAAGKAWVKGKVEAGKEWVKGKAEAGRAWVKRGRSGRPEAAVPESAADKEARLRAAVQEVRALTGRRERLSILLGLRLGAIRRRYGLTELTANRKGSANAWEVVARVNPEARFELVDNRDDSKELRAAIGAGLANLPKDAQIHEVRKLCDVAAKRLLEPGYTLDWVRATDAWVLYLNRPGHDVARTAVGRFTKATEYTEIDKDEGQTLYHNSEKKHFVNDAAGQFVPRIVVRNITPQDLRSIKKKLGIPSTGPRAKIRIWQHVTGKKPSQYISSTKEGTGAIQNPQGQQIGAHGRVRIDLFRVSPKVIFDLTTRKGQDAWELSDPDTPIKRQALEDVIRTEEVLIKGEIPQRAIELMSE